MPAGSRRFFHATVLLCCAFFCAALPPSALPSYFLGFDSNNYPGDDTLPSLRRTFSFAGYWLNTPPSAETNSWTGKRAAILQNDFGFLVLFNGRTSYALRNSANVAELGKADAQAAVTSAQQEGFHAGTVIFLDQEEGGRMTDDQNAYIFGWIDGVIAGGFKAGIYCSGMPAKDDRGTAIVTANDIRSHAGERQLEYFVYNDTCPPSTGCAYGKAAPAPSMSGVEFASVWQFAQSPRRREFTKRCAATYNSDGNCYAPGAGHGSTNLDLNSALLPDPSGGRK